MMIKIPGERKLINRLILILSLMLILTGILFYINNKDNDQEQKETPWMEWKK